MKNMFEYYGHIHVYSPGAGADNPLGTNCFHKHKIFCPFAHFMQVLPFKSYFNNFTHSNALATYVDLVVTKVKVIPGPLLDASCQVSKS